MFKNITLGQYFPGNSPLHRADPRFKIIITLIYIVSVFVCKNLYSYLFLIAATIAIIAVSKIPLKIVFSGFKTIFFIIFFTALINIFWTKGEKLIFEWGIIHIYREGIIYACAMIIRLVCLLCSTAVMLSYTTSPISLTDGLEQLLSPLKKINVPVHEFAMMMTIALRFIPTLIEETDKITSAQKARGADFAHGGLMSKAKALVPILIPLFVSAFRRADELATAMECRGYRGGEGRTRMKQLKASPLDAILLVMFTAEIAGIILLNFI